MESTKNNDNAKIMRIKKITLHQVELKLNNSFRTSYGQVTKRPSIIIEIEDYDDYFGIGECVAFGDPSYTEETIDTCFHIIKEFLIPLLLEQEITHPNEVEKIFTSVRGNNMAKAALEGAVWDLYAKKNLISLSKAIGGAKKEIEVGITIGIKKTSEMLKDIGNSIKEGYKRVKIKIKPGIEHELLGSIRRIYPNLPLMVDANSAYTIDDLEVLKSLDQYNLMMIEQPLSSDDFLDHARLQKEIKTPICLDESITSVQDARLAIELGSCKIMNLKIARLGGFSVLKKVHDLCMENDIAIWGGGMLEGGIARAQALAAYSLPHFSFPSDIGPSYNYWEKDIIDPEITMDQGVIKVPNLFGFGFSLNHEVFEKQLVKKREFYTLHLSKDLF